MCRSGRSVALGLLVALLVAAVAGCGGAPAAGKGVLSIEASFYPLQWMAQQVGGDKVHVSSLAKAGAEPHDLELTPRDVADLDDADVVLYLGGFQPAVDEAVAQIDEQSVFDAARPAHLDLTFTPIEGGKRNALSAGRVDPHFWLDPTRLAAVAGAFGRRLAGIDPAHAAFYTANAKKLSRTLDGLDHDLARGLASCENRDLVTSHNAFGYLARRYRLVQVGITGLTPEEEPTPDDLASVTDFVKQHRVRTIYFETLVSHAIASTVADETGARTAVLDPIEGLTSASPARDYVGIMRANLASMKKGQPCP